MLGYYIGRAFRRPYGASMWLWGVVLLVGLVAWGLFILEPQWFVYPATSSLDNVKP